MRFNFQHCVVDFHSNSKIHAMRQGKFFAGYNYIFFSTHYVKLTLSLTEPIKVKIYKHEKAEEQPRQRAINRKKDATEKN